MSGSRKPGPMCKVERPFWVEDGTMCRTETPPPGPSRMAPEVMPTTTQVSAADQETLDKVQRMRKLAKFMGFTQAVEALDHFLAASGDFVEIPPDKVRLVRRESETAHKQKLIQVVKSPIGARTLLALTALVDPTGKAKAEARWISPVIFKMEYMSGTSRPGVSDDNLAYYGSAIKSEVTIECRRVPGKPRCYRCRIVGWRSWVVDNYDWEGDKQFGGDNKLIRWLLPTQRQMNSLTKIGHAKSYQRSSRSWRVDLKEQPWEECFQEDREIEEAARSRQQKIEQGREQAVREQADGALPIPGPAEERL